MTASESDSGHVVDWARAPLSEPYPGVRARRFDTARSSVFRYELAPDAQYPVHEHPEEQLLHVLAGTVAFRVADRELVLGAGDLVHVEGGVPHGARGAGPGTATFLNIVMPRRS